MNIIGTDIPGDSWQEIHSAAKGITAQDPGKAIERMHAFNAEIRRIARKKQEAAEKERLLAAQKKRKEG